MKKVITFFLILIMIFSFAACEEENPSSSKKSTSKSKNNKQEEIVIPEYTIRFISNGGTSVEPITTSKLEIAPVTTKTNHDFEGWFVDESLTQAAIFPMKINDNTTLYAKWLKTANKINCSDCYIKAWTGHSNAYTYEITPSGFDFETLQARGYRKIEIEVTYDVYYKKDYELGIGYAGSPKYEITLANQENLGKQFSDLTTNKQADNRSITKTINISDVNTNSYTLKFSTDNIQNIIYFENIKVTYYCYK